MKALLFHSRDHPLAHALWRRLEELFLMITAAAAERVEAGAGAGVYRT